MNLAHTKISHQNSLYIQIENKKSHIIRSCFPMGPIFNIGRIQANARPSESFTPLAFKSQCKVTCSWWLTQSQFRRHQLMGERLWVLFPAQWDVCLHGIVFHYRAMSYCWLCEKILLFWDTICETLTYNVEGTLIHKQIDSQNWQ